MPAMTITLPTDYYLNNFKQLVDFVFEIYSDVLSPPEKEFYQIFHTLEEDSQRLYIRLLCRSKSLFRLSRLSYPEISNLDHAARQLAQYGLAQLNPELSLSELLALFTMAEIKTRLNSTALRGLSREVLEQCVIEHSDETTIPLLCRDETIIAVLGEECFASYKLCFFGNLHQDMTAFVLRDLGLHRFEHYRIDTTTRLFTSRPQLEAHLQYYRCLQILTDTIEAGAESIMALHEQIPAATLEDTLLTRRRDRLINRLARALERLDLPDAALQLYQQAIRPPARERATRLQLKLGNIDHALELCKKILAAPMNEEEAVFASGFAYRSAKKHARPWPKPPVFKPHEQHLELAPTDTTVEIAAAHHFATDGDCYWVENTLFNGITGLAYWDIIFTPIRGAFINPFQSAPSDFHDPEFLQARARLIRQRQSELADIVALSAIVWQHFHTKQNLRNPLVSWHALKEDLIAQVLERIPIEHWQAIFNRILADRQHNRTGLPDLIHFPEAGGYRLIEVKGPGDKLQKNQLRWLQYFADHGIPYSVVYVSYALPSIS